MPSRVLVVEDDRYFSGILRDYLGYLGLDVIAAEDGLAGWETYQAEQPSLVLSDVLLPRMDGLELATRVKEVDGASTPVLLMSAVYKDDTAIQRNLRQCGADGYLVKPFSMPELRAALEKHLPQLAVEQAATEQLSDPAIAVIRFKPEVPLPTSGQIEKGFLAPLLLRIRRAAHTGVLELNDESRWKKIVFSDGRPVWADGDGNSDRMGTMLLEEGTIIQSQFAQAADAMREREIDFGTALVDERVLTPGELYTQLRRLVERRVIAAFGWSVGEWKLCEGLPRQTTSFELLPLAVIWKGLRAHGDAASMKGELKQFEGRYVLATDRFRTDWGELKREEGIGFLGTFLNGQRTFAQLREMEILSEGGLVRALWMLYKGGMIAFSERPAGDGSAADQTLAGPITAEGPGLGRNLTAQGELIISDYLRFWQADFFSIFGLSAQASDAEIRKALQTSPLSWDPRALPDELPRELGKKAMSLWHWVEEGRRTLSDPEARVDYASRIQDGLTGVYRKVSAAEKTEASMFFDMGKEFLQMRDFREAELSFAKAVERVPEIAEYTAYQGWAVYRRGSGSKEAFDGARMLLTRALAIDSHLPIAHYFLGVMHRDQKHYSEALAHFESATRFDPMFTAAQKALDQCRALSDEAAR